MGHVRRDQLRAFWRLIAQGLSTEESARRGGVDEATGLRWFHKGGGMTPLSLLEQVHGRTLNVAEREQLLAGIHTNKSMRVIAGELDRSPSTISRELARNLRDLHGQDDAARDRPAAVRRSPWKYSPHRAQLRADKAAARPKPAKRATSPRLRDDVQVRLEQNHSPEPIERRLLLHLPDDHDALAVQEAMIEQTSKLPDALRNTLTWDQGTEMANPAQIAKATQPDIYFCCPAQRTKPMR